MLLNKKKILFAGGVALVFALVVGYRWYVGQNSAQNATTNPASIEAPSDNIQEEEQQTDEQTQSTEVSSPRDNSGLVVYNGSNFLTDKISAEQFSKFTEQFPQYLKEQGIDPETKGLIYWRVDKTDTSTTFYISAPIDTIYHKVTIDDSGVHIERVDKANLPPLDDPNHTDS